MSLSPLKKHGAVRLTEEGQNDAVYDGIAGAVGVGRDDCHDRHPAIKPRARAVENESDILDGFGVQRKPKRGDGPRICTLHHRRLAFCIPVLFVLYQHRNLYLVDGIHPRAYSWRVSARLRHSFAAVHPSPNGVRTPWRHGSPPAGATGLLGDELWLSNTVRNVGGADGLWRRPRRVCSDPTCNDNLIS